MIVCIHVGHGESDRLLDRPERRSRARRLPDALSVAVRLARGVRESERRTLGGRCCNEHAKELEEIVSLAK